MGGAYGGKITRPAQLAIASALAAVRLNRPVRMVMSMEANMAAMGKRVPYASDYEVNIFGFKNLNVYYFGLPKVFG